MSDNLNEGEVCCDKCNGSGYIENNQKECRTFRIICDKCNGDGKLDWIENVLGKQNIKVNIITNRTTYDVNIEDLGYTIKAGDQIELSDIYCQKHINASESLKELINMGVLKYITWENWS